MADKALPVNKYTGNGEEKSETKISSRREFQKFKLIAKGPRINKLGTRIKKQKRPVYTFNGHDLRFQVPAPGQGGGASKIRISRRSHETSGIRFALSFLTTRSKFRYMALFFPYFIHDLLLTYMPGQIYTVDEKCIFQRIFCERSKSFKPTIF